MNTPDRWIIISIKDPSTGDSFKKILCSYYGGYLGSDSWKISSSIEQEEKDEAGYIFTTLSGSQYYCRFTSYGVSGMMCSILNEMQQIEGAEITVEEEYGKSDS